jgi:hypothetical protein
MEEKEESDVRKIGGKKKHFTDKKRKHGDNLREREVRERWQLQLQMEEQRMKHEN